MAEQKATEVCLVAQAAYPESRRETLTLAPPIGYLLRIERETPETVFRCIYAITDGRKIHDGACRFEGGPPEADDAEPAAVGVEESPADESGC